MNMRDGLTRLFAVAGTVLVWLPILVPAVFCLIVLVRSGGFHFDFLMPAELFPVVLLGGGLLLWAALRAHLHGRRIGWSLAVTAAFLVGFQAFAILTGMASGDVEPQGWLWAGVLVLIAAFWIASIALGVGGILLLRSVFAPSRPEAAG
jgi:hypothetical protein